MVDPVYNEYWPGVDDTTARKIPAIMLPQMAATAVTNAGPDPALPGPLGYIPFTGAAEGLAGFAGTMYELGRAGAAKLGMTNLPPAPDWMKAAGEHWGNTQQQVAEQIPHYQPTAEEQADPGYQHGVAMSGILGNAVPVVPGSALAALPKAVSVPLSLMAPTTLRPATDAIIAGTTGPALSMVLDSGQAQAAQPDTGDLFKGIADPFPQAQQAKGSTPGAQSSATPDFSGISDPFHTGGTTAPDFHEEGSSPYTWGQAAAAFGIVLGSIIAARYAHGLGGGVTAAARDARMTNPDYMQAVTDFNNNELRVKAGDITATPQAPLPGAANRADVVSRVAASAKNNLLDSTALTQNYINFNSDAPSTAQALSHTYQNAYNESTWQAKLREFLHTGVDDSSKISMPAWEGVQRDIAALPDDKAMTLAQGLLSANEMDNRINNQAKGMTNYAHDFANSSDAQLNAYTNTMLADPVLRDIAERYWQIGQALPRVGEARDFFTTKEANDLNTQHPHYTPEANVNGEILHALGPRDTTPRTGVDSMTTMPWVTMAQHIESLMHNMETMDAQRPLVDHQLALQQQYPNSAGVLERTQSPYPGGNPTYGQLAPAANAAREPIIMIRRSTGIEFYKVKNPDFYNMVSMRNPARTRMATDVLNWPRRWLQFGTTGVGSLLSGRAFPLTHLFRTGLAAQTNRPAGFVAGPVELAAKRLGIPRVPGADLLTYPFGWAYSGARAGVDDLALHLSQMFDKSNPSFPTQMLKSMLTPQRMDVLSDTLKKYYLGTTTHEMRAGGASGMGMPYQVRPPAMAQKDAMGTPIRLVSAELTPKLFINNSLTGSIRPHLIDLRAALEHTYGNIMDAGQQYFYRLNKFAGNIDPQTLTYETRALMGDMGVSGAGRLAQGLAKTMPYANISAQGTARLGRAFKETPVGTTAAVITNLGMLAALSLYTSMQNAQTRNYLQSMITTQGRAANVTLFGNSDPSLNTSFSLQQELRPFYPLILDAMSKVLNFDAMDHDPVWHDRVLSFFKDLFSEHIENSSLTSMWHGLTDQWNFLDVPSALNAVSSLTGGPALRVDLAKIQRDWQDGRLGLGTFAVPQGTDKPLPNSPSGDSLFDGQDAKVLHNTVSYLLGSMSYVADDLMGFVRHWQKTPGDWVDKFSTAAGQLGRDWVQHAMDMNPNLNGILWENQARESVRPPNVEAVERQLQLMRIPDGSIRQQLLTGTTGGPRPLPVPTDMDHLKVPQDLSMQDIYYTTARTYKYIETKLMPDINAIKKQMQAVSDQVMPNDEKRQWMNNQTRVISDKYRYIQTFIDDANAKLSAKYGRSINIGKAINWHGSLDSNFPAQAN